MEERREDNNRYADKSWLYKCVHCLVSLKTEQVNIFYVCLHYYNQSLCLLWLFAALCVGESLQPGL